MKSNNTLMVHEMAFQGKSILTAEQVLGYKPEGYVLCSLHYDHAVIWLDGKAFFSFLVKFVQE